MSEAAPADDWGGLGGWRPARGGEGGRAKAADVDPGGLGIDALPLLLLDISPVAVSAGSSSVYCVRFEIKGICLKQDLVCLSIL